MTFNFIKLPELDFDLKAETTESGRKYVTPNGARYPSVTTVLSSYNKKAIMEWRQRYILGELTEMKRQTLMPLDKMMFGQLRPKLDKHVGDVYCLEQALYSDGLRLAGRVDLIAEWDGELAVIDFKSSTKEKQEGNIRNYFMQCSAYAEMFDEITNLPINKIVVAIATEEEVPQIFVKDKKEYLPELNQFIDKYWSDIAV